MFRLSADLTTVCARAARQAALAQLSTRGNHETDICGFVTFGFGLNRNDFGSRTKQQPACDYVKKCGSGEGNRAFRKRHLRECGLAARWQADCSWWQAWRGVVGN